MPIKGELMETNGKKMYISVSPSGWRLGFLTADTEEAVWKLLIENGGHLPYLPSKEAFIERGYRVVPVTQYKDE